MDPTVPISTPLSPEPPIADAANGAPPVAVSVEPVPLAVPPEEALSAPAGPSIADDREYALDPNYVRVQKLVGWIATGILSPILLAGLVAAIVAKSDDWPMWVFVAGGVGWVVLTALLCWSAQFWPSIEYRYQRYRVNAEGIEIRRGVWWREVISVPRSRVQHTDVNQGPIERRFGIAHLVIHTAGTIGATVRLEGLTRDRAHQIRDYLVASGSDDAV